MYTFCNHLNIFILSMMVFVLCLVKIPVNQELNVKMICVFVTSLIVTLYLVNIYNNEGFTLLDKTPEEINELLQNGGALMFNYNNPNDEASNCGPPLQFINNEYQLIVPPEQTEGFCGSCNGL
jgi:hypothetical protein